MAPLLAFLLALIAPAAPLRALPPIVFVERAAFTGADSLQVPGLGVRGALAHSRGRLLRREPDGRVRELLAAGAFDDVQDPDVTPDGRDVLFSGLARGESHWRLWRVNAAGGEAAEVTARDETRDDTDPCALGGLVIFARIQSTGDLYNNGPRAQLVLRRLRDGREWTLTSEANAALDPTIDPHDGRIVFARWWYNPWRSDSLGTLRAPTFAGAAHTSDEVDTWQIVSAHLVQRGDAYALEDLRLAAGGVSARRAGMGVQPCVTPRGIVAVQAHAPSLAPAPGALALARFGAAPGAAVRIAGAALSESADDAYAEGANLSAPGALAPAALPDGSVLASLDRGARGRFGLWRLAADGALAAVYESDSAVALDAAVIAPHANARIATRPPAKAATFTFVDRDLYAGDGAPARRGDARLRFWRLSGDSLVHERDVRVPASGRVAVTALPAHTPMFEQLVDGAGRTLLTAHGPAQVRGFNSGAPGATVSCRGCHLGHSTLR